MAKKQPKIDIEGMAFGEFEVPPKLRGGQLLLKKRDKKKPKKPPRKRPVKKQLRKPGPREKTIKIDVEVHPVRSTRGTFEEDTFRRVESEIIHFIEYDIVTKQLAVQLTAAGKWLWYTYQGVSAQTADDFSEAPSKGQYFNAVIKKHSFKRGNTIRGATV